MVTSPVSPSALMSRPLPFFPFASQRAPRQKNLNSWSGRLLPLRTAFLIVVFITTLPLVWKVEPASEWCCFLVVRSRCLIFCCTNTKGVKLFGWALA